MARIAHKVFYEGRVQGVGFRYTVKRIATGYEVAGWVRNLPDGRVELEAHGEQDEVTSFMDEIEKSELASLISNSEKREINHSGEARGFEIRF